MKDQIMHNLDTITARSAWARGVKMYAAEMIADKAIDDLATLIAAASRLTPNESATKIKNSLLDGAGDWTEYSYGGCALIYNADIAARLCNPSELKRTKHGKRNPNGRETWLDVQARALHQAAALVTNAIQEMAQKTLAADIIAAQAKRALIADAIPTAKSA